MKSILHCYSGIALLFCLFFFTNCERVLVTGPDDVTPTPSALEFISRTSDVSTLNSLLGEVGLDQKLTERPFTFFAPTNEAFQRFVNDNEAYNTINDIPSAVLQSLMDYHFMSQNSVILRDTIAAYINTDRNTDFDALLTMFVKTESGIRINGERNVALQDVRVTNGIIHLMDELAIPPNVFTLISANPELSTLTETLEREDFSIDFLETLSGDGPFTIFAPTDSAFLDLMLDLDIGCTNKEKKFPVFLSCETIKKNRERVRRTS